MIPKPIRIKDAQALVSARKPYCQYCGKVGGCQVHHIITKGAGGHDTPDNLISLCISCHAKCHSGQISKAELYKAKEVDDESNSY